MKILPSLQSFRKYIYFNYYYDAVKSTIHTELLIGIKLRCYIFVCQIQVTKMSVKHPKVAPTCKKEVIPK